MLCIIPLTVLILSSILPKTNFQVWIHKYKTNQLNQFIKMQSSVAVFTHQQMSRLLSSVLG